MEDEKFVVFKRDEFESWASRAVPTFSMEVPVLPRGVDDAVVIRRQDMFAASALDTYADSISVAISVMGMCSDDNVNGTVSRLQRIADYFRAQAELARDTHGKVPD